MNRGLMPGDPTKGVSCAWLEIPGGLQGYQGALRELRNKPAFIARYRLPLFAPYWESYLRHLLDRGYSKLSICRYVLSHLLHFHRFLARRKVRELAEVTPELISVFLRQKQLPSQNRDGQPFSADFIRRARGGITRFLNYVARQRGAPDFDASPPFRFKVLSDKLVESYLAYASTHLGLRPRTRQAHLYRLADLETFLHRRKVRSVRQVTITDLDAFITHCSRRMQPRSLRNIASALRSFFRYLHLHGVIATDLARDVVSPMGFSCDLWPKFIPWQKVEELLAGIDRSRSGGKRDYAVLVLMACHGLRNREVATLRVSDIDWERRCLLLRDRKNGSTTWLPLSQPTLAALRDYVRVRPHGSYPQLFLTQHAPIKPLGFAAHAVAQKHLRRRFAGSLPHYGAHTLRHSFAKALLDRGAKLPDIGALLGHRVLGSSLVYTRVATEDLRDVADNYAEFLAGHAKASE